MEVQDFMKFADTLPLSKDIERANGRVRTAMVRYLVWRTGLSDKERLRTPCLMMRFPPGDKMQDKATMTHLFFPIRWTPYKGKKQLVDEAHAVKIREETERDKAKLGIFLRALKDVGAKLDVEKVEFTS
ncbi:ATP binding cassette transporter [Coprinopsis cinerea AmutBmut pab1-1]|nr:ATP binding cassette transporter [Coprinopsis cinerea AmutBmut pab1-1]